MTARAVFIFVCCCLVLIVIVYVSLSILDAVCDYRVADGTLQLSRSVDLPYDRAPAVPPSPGTTFVYRMPRARFSIGRFQFEKYDVVTQQNYYAKTFVQIPLWFVITIPVACFGVAIVFRRRMRQVRNG